MLGETPVRQTRAPAPIPAVFHSYTTIASIPQCGPPRYWPGPPCSWRWCAPPAPPPPPASSSTARSTCRAATDRARRPPRVRGPQLPRGRAAIGGGPSDGHASPLPAPATNPHAPQASSVMSKTAAVSGRTAWARWLGGRGAARNPPTAPTTEPPPQFPADPASPNRPAAGQEVRRQLFHLASTRGEVPVCRPPSPLHGPAALPRTRPFTALLAPCPLPSPSTQACADCMAATTAATTAAVVGRRAPAPAAAAGRAAATAMATATGTTMRTVTRARAAGTARAATMATASTAAGTARRAATTATTMSSGTGGEGRHDPGQPSECPAHASLGAHPN